jgi:endo-1,4-beta-xylanase
MSHEQEQSNIWNQPLLRRTLLAGVGASVLGVVAGCNEKEPPIRDCDNLPSTAEHKEVEEPTNLNHYNWHIPGVERTAEGHLHVVPTAGEAVPMNMYGARLDLHGDFAVGADITLGKGAEFAMHLKAGVALSYEGGFMQSPASVRIRCGERGGSLDIFRSETDKQFTRAFTLGTGDRNKQIVVNRQGDKIFVHIGDQTILGPLDDVFTSGHLWFGLASESAATHIRNLTVRGDAEIYDTSTIELPPCPTGLAARTKAKIAGRKPFAVGVATKLSAFVSDAKYASLLTGEFESLTTENAGKMRFLQPAEEEFAFGELDSIIDFATRHKKETWLHTLVWDKELPNWVQHLSATHTREVMIRHITAVGEHTRRRVKGIDVVNEPLTNYDATMRDSPWLRSMGEQYIRIAFQTASRANPEAELWLNEYGWDKANQADEARFQKLFAIVKDLKDKGIRIDGIGSQGHVLQIPRDNADIPTLRRRIASFADLGVKVRISEIDVTPDAGRAKQAKQFSDMFELALSDPNISGYTVWGVGGPHVSTASTHEPTLVTRTLWDENLEPTAAYAALQEQLV